MVNRSNQILDEGSSRTKGVDALNSNIEAAKAVAAIVKTTLGPLGMDKMLIDSLGESIITNDGVKILKEMEIEHPGAKMLVEVAKTQESEVGDGTTTAVILSGELLTQAQDLIQKKIHPTTIVRGYKKASLKALEVLDKNSVEVDTNNERVIRDICETAMTGKVAESAKEKLSEILFEATMLVKNGEGIPKNSVKIVKITGGDTSNSFVVSGIVLDKNLANSNMPKNILNARVLLCDFALEVRELDSEANLSIQSPQDYQDFLAQEHEYLKALAYRIKEIGANVVFCQKGIDDNVAYYLAKEGILATRRTRKSDMERLSAALGVPVISNEQDLGRDKLGECRNVEYKELLGESYVFATGMKHPKAISILLKGSTKHILDEIERAVDDAIGDISALVRSKKIVAGGGAVEVELYKELNRFAKTFEGKEQLVVKAFAESFLSIPKTLCENSGFDEIEVIANLISNHERKLDKSGIDGFVGVVEDTMRKRIVEPINVKEQAIKSATEIASMILRIDDIIAARKLNVGGKRDEEGEF